MRKLFLFLMLILGLHLNAQVLLMDTPFEEESQIFDEINSLMDNELYMSAIKKIEKLKQNKQLSHGGYYILMYNYLKTGDLAKIISTYNDWEKHASLLNNQLEAKSSIQQIYSLNAYALENTGQYQESILSYEKSIGLDKDDKNNAAICYRSISKNYEKLELLAQAKTYIDKSINIYLTLLNIDIDDIAKISSNLHDDFIFNGLLLSILQKGLLLVRQQSYTESLYYLALAASCGEETALSYFRELDLDFHKYLKK